MDKKKIRDDFDNLIRINLNGEWEVFEQSIKDLKKDISDMSDEEIKELKTKLKEKLND